ncbi:MAG: hypothetical protein ACLSAP_03160 [Oscillospiraceae bacterium]
MKKVLAAVCLITMMGALFAGCTNGKDGSGEPGASSVGSAPARRHDGSNLASDVSPALRVSFGAESGAWHVSASSPASASFPASSPARDRWCRQWNPL